LSLAHSSGIEVGRSETRAAQPAPPLDVVRLRHVVARIQQRQSLYRLAFSKSGVTRTSLYQQALAFEEWLAQIVEEIEDHADPNP
jgi:hypothetical protein